MKLKLLAAIIVTSFAIAANSQAIAGQTFPLPPIPGNQSGDQSTASTEIVDDGGSLKMAPAATAPGPQRIGPQAVPQSAQPAQPAMGGMPQGVPPGALPPGLMPEGSAGTASQGGAPQSVPPNQAAAMGQMPMPGAPASGQQSMPQSMPQGMPQGMPQKSY